MNRTASILQHLTDILFVLPVLLIPLLFTSFNTDTNIIKETVFQFGVVFLFLAYPATWYLDRKYDPESSSAVIPKTFIFLLFALLVYLYYSSHLSVKHPRAIYEFSRWFTYIGLTFITIFYSVSPRRFNLYIAITLFTCCLVCAYALCQAGGLDFYDWPSFEWDDTQHRRICSSLGNPDFLAGYLVPLLPLTFIYFLIQPQRLLFVILFFLQILTLIFSYSRGGWISTYLTLLLLFSSFLYINYVYDPVLVKFKLSFRAVTFTVAGFFFTGVTMLILWWDKIETALFRFSNLEQGASVITRPMFYKGAWNMWLDHPIQGIGLGTFGLNFENYRSQELSTYLSFKDFNLDHVHNELLEIASETGIIGLILYLAIFIFVTVFVWRILLKYRHKENLVLLGLWGGIVGIQIHNLFTVTLRHSTTAFMYWSFIGLIIGYGSLIYKKHSKPDIFFQTSLFLLTPIIVLYLSFSASNHFMGDCYIRNGWDYIQKASELLSKNGSLQDSRQSLSDALIYLHKGERLSPYREKAPFWLGLAYNNALDYSQGAAAYKDVNTLHRNFTAIYMNIAITYLKQTDLISTRDYLQPPLPTFEYLGSECIREAVTWMKLAVEDDPGLPLYYRILGRCYFNLGEFDKAKEMITIGLEKAKNKPDKETAESVADMQRYLQQIEKIKK